MARRSEEATSEGGDNSMMEQFDVEERACDSSTAVFESHVVALGLFAASADRHRDGIFAIVSTDAEDMVFNHIRRFQPLCLFSGVSRMDLDWGSSLRYVVSSSRFCFGLGLFGERSFVRERGPLSDSQHHL